MIEQQFEGKLMAVVGIMEYALPFFPHTRINDGNYKHTL